MRAYSNTMLEFLLLQPTEEATFLAIHVYAVHSAVNHVRAGQLPHGSLNLIMELWEKWRSAMAQQESVSKLIASSWRTGAG